jgi:glycosyltransferase involved in cell wall biosynthesis
MVQHGHECSVLTTGRIPYEFEGVKVYPDDFYNARDLWNWCDVGITHLGRTGKAINWALQVRKPLMYITHNTYWNRMVEVKRTVYIVYNADWAKKDLQAKGYDHENITVHPPVWFDDYHVARPKRKYVALLNCNENKGGKIFIEIASRMPDIEFLGVIGMYGDQERDDTLPNLKYIPNTPNIKEVYAQMKLMLMPSDYESYGRTSVEACCSGIPVIANATPGLTEALGDAGLFVKDRNDVSEWVNLIRATLEKDTYKAQSAKCLSHAKTLNERNTTEMKGFESFCKYILQEHGKIHRKA